MGNEESVSKREEDYRWEVPEGQEPTEMDRIILQHQKNGRIVPERRLVLNAEQIEGVRRSGVVNTGALDAVEAAIHPGMTTDEIDQLVFNYLTEHNAFPADLNYKGFPKSVCVSINNQVCHGVPDSMTVLKEGDIVNVDITTVLDGYYSDASRMFIVGGKTIPSMERLVKVSKECLHVGMKAAKPYCFAGDIGYAIEKFAMKNGYSVVHELAGHGVGLRFHDAPCVLHFGRKGSGMLIVPGMVFTIEPMINMGSRYVVLDSKTGWTIYTKDGKPSAQWEHTFLMTEDGLEILSY